MVSKQVRRALLASQVARQANELELWTTCGPDDQFSLPRQIRWSAALGKLLVVNSATVPLQIRNADLSYAGKVFTHEVYTQAVDADASNVFVLRSGGSIRKYNLEITSFDYYGRSFQTSLSLDVNSSDSIFTTVESETVGHGVTKTRKSDGVDTASILSTGSGNGQFSNPRGLFFYDNHVYVCDYSNSRIVKLLASDLSFVSNISLAYSPLDLCTDGVNWYVQSATTLYKYDMSFTDGTKTSTAITGYTITIVPDQSDGNGQTIAISDGANHRLHRVKCSDLSLVRTLGSLGDGSSTLVPLRVDFPAQYAGTARWEFSDGEIIPAVSGAAISWNGFTGYTPRTAGARAVLKGVPVDQITRVGMAACGITGDVTPSLRRLRNCVTMNLETNTALKVDLSQLTEKMVTLAAHGCGGGPTGSVRHMTAIETLNLRENGYLTAQVDQIIDDIYQNKDINPGFPTINLNGSNQAPGVAALAQIDELINIYGYTIAHSV